MKFRHINPILYANNVVNSITYYRDVLCFENSWCWGEPPTFGGVSKDGVEIFFCENGQGSPGTWLSIFVDNVDVYYEKIKTNGAKILSAPENMEWGIREMLVEDPDGHKIRFGCSVHVKADNRLQTMPDTIKIIERIPTAAEHLALIDAVGWKSSLTEDMEARVLNAPVYAVVAEDTVCGKTIGCALLLGDDASFYYVKDVMVAPNFQNKRVGTALMEALTSWLDKHAANHALVGLYTGDSLAPFYEKFGFKRSFGMNRTIHRDGKI